MDKPYIIQKGVILCRSGIQLYSYNEVFSALGEPPVKKDYYREYRPASVVVKAKDLCRSLPVTKEHPHEFVTPDNWKELCGGTLDNEVEVVALDGESEGEIGLKSNITFYTRELYDYYLHNNKEVSLGYTCKKHYVTDNEDYDIILDSIDTINHLAITSMGRGGESVSIIDRMGGMKPMRSGIFSFLKKKDKGNIEESFGNKVIKAETEEEIRGVMDSLQVLKDCDKKVVLESIVKDCLDNRDKLEKSRDELISILDSMYDKIKDSSAEEISAIIDTKEESVMEEEKKDEEKEEVKDTEKEEVKDTEEEKKDEVKDTEEEKKEEKEEAKDTECGKEEVKDSVTLDSIKALIEDSIKALVPQLVKETLGIDEKKPGADGLNLDSVSVYSTRDYESFLK